MQYNVKAIIGGRSDLPTRNAGNLEFTVVEFIPTYGGDTCIEENPISIPAKTDWSIELASLMFFQLLHDERFHRDINNLPLIQRLKHLHNHLVKYNANIERKSENLGDIKKEVVDSCIVCISALTALGYGGYTNESLGDWYFKRTVIQDKDVIHQLGKAAKLLEGWDHTEYHNYITELQIIFVNLLAKFLSIYYQRIGNVFHNSYVDRLRAIQVKNPLYLKIINHYGEIKL